MVKYIPQERDIVYIDLSPIKGHEQNGKRPALVVSCLINLQIWQFYVQ